jgi:hypothetical protein
MKIRQKRYQMMICRGLLLAGYLFLFASQFNYRYFRIANFYVYHANNVSGIARIVRTGGEIHVVNHNRPMPLQRPVALEDNTHRPAHLGIDKRYRFQQGIRVPEIRGPGQPFCASVTLLVSSYCSYYSSSSAPVNALRGPPGVHCMLRCC